MARNRSEEDRNVGSAGLLADTGLVRPARYLQRGDPSGDGREIHRKGGRQAEEFYREPALSLTSPTGGPNRTPRWSSARYGVANRGRRATSFRIHSFAVP